MSYTISYVRTYDIVRTTYDIVKKTYDVVRFYPFLAILTYDIVCDIVRFLTMSHMMCSATSVLYDIERKVPMSLAHIVKNIRYSATTSYAIS